MLYRTLHSSGGGGADPDEFLGLDAGLDIDAGIELHTVLVLDTRIGLHAGMRPEFFATRWSGGDAGSSFTVSDSGFGIWKEMPGMVRHGGTDEEEDRRLEVAEREEEDDPCSSSAVGGEENDLFGDGGMHALRLATTSQ
jgi:hypothetical protein